MDAPAELGRRGPTRLVAVGLSATAMVLCCPDYDVWWLGFVAWVPFFFAIEGLAPRRALVYGWLIGFITVLWGFFWMSELMTRFAGFSLAGALPITALFAAWHGLIWGLSAMIIVWLRARSRLPIWVLAPPAWVTLEAALPNIFPIYMALGWSWQPLWIQSAELGGVTTVSAVMVAINAGLYALLHTWWTERALDRPAAAFTLAMVTVVPAYGALRISMVSDEMESAEHLKIGAVQGNMGIGMMANPRFRHGILREQQRKSAELQSQGAELVVWGETAYPNARAFTRVTTTEPARGNPWRLHTEDFTIAALVGTVTFDGTRRSPYPWNTALLIDGDGRVVADYDKVYRLIFGEYIPLVDPDWYLSLVPSASHLAQGAGPEVMELGDYRLGPFICYEDILPRYVRQTANGGVNVLVNLTNDAWFGKTREPAQHLGLAVFRTIEHRKPMVRAVNTGISTYIDPTGTVRVMTEVTDPDVEGRIPADGFVADVPMMDARGRTPYGYTGEAFNALCGLFCGFVGWRGRRR